MIRQQTGLSNVRSDSEKAGKVAAEFSLTRLDGVPDELWAVAASYWEHDGLDARGHPSWARPVRNVPSDGWGGGANIVAGAGGIASILGMRCPKCGGTLTLTSRTGYANALSEDPDGCRSCTSGFEAKVATVNMPGARERYLDHQFRIEQQRQHQAEQVASRAREQDQLQIVERTRRDAIAEEYGTIRGDEAPSAWDLDVQQRVVTLALMQYFADQYIIGPVEDFEDSLAPHPLLTRDLIASIDGFILVRHPSTPTNAFQWMAEHGDASATLSTTYTPARLRLHLGTGQPQQSEWDEQARSLQSSLILEGLDRSEMDDLLELAQELIAAEAISYLDFKLADDYRLAPVPEQHRLRVEEMLLAAAAELSLGHLYRAIWTVTSAATNLKASRPTMAKANLATFAVNKLETLLQEYMEPSFDRLHPYRIDSRNPLSALTRTIFYRLLKSDPLSAAISEIRETMPVPTDERFRSKCRTDTPDGAPASDALRASCNRWTGQEFRQAIAAIEIAQIGICTQGCAHSRQNSLAARVGRSYDKLVNRMEPEAAAFALLETIPFLNSELADEPFERPGDLLLHLIARELGINSDDETTTV